MEEKKAKILVVDDDTEFLQEVKGALESHNYNALTAKTMAEAQEVVRREKPDLVILGTLEHRGDAYHLHQWVKQSLSLKDLPLVVIDATPEQQLIKGWRWDEGMQLEAEDYFQKPVEPGKIMPHVMKILDKVTRRIKVLVVDDHVVVREGIRILLGLQPDIQVVGEAIDGSEAIKKVHELMPDIVLMDIAMPGMDGLEATKELTKEEGEQARILMLTQYADDENVRASAKAGAFGFIPKSSASSQLLDAIRAASKGEHISIPPESDR
jgi:DNA-binding NarL/FixJ family response regulator